MVFGHANGIRCFVSLFFIVLFKTFSPIGNIMQQQHHTKNRKKKLIIFPFYFSSISRARLMHSFVYYVPLQYHHRWWDKWNVKMKIKVWKTTVKKKNSFINENNEPSALACESKGAKKQWNSKYEKIYNKCKWKYVILMNS